MQDLNKLLHREWMLHMLTYDYASQHSKMHNLRQKNNVISLSHLCPYTLIWRNQPPFCITCLHYSPCNTNSSELRFLSSETQISFINHESTGRKLHLPVVDPPPQELRATSFCAVPVEVNVIYCNLNRSKLTNYK